MDIKIHYKTVGDIIDQLEEEEKQEMTDKSVVSNLANELLRSQHPGLQDLKILANSSRFQSLWRRSLFNRILCYSTN